MTGAMRGRAAELDVDMLVGGAGLSILEATIDP